MSLSIGGLGLLFPWSPVRVWDHALHTRPGFRSFVCALVLLAVLLILAYLTNPSEISFRAYLTEQSFRQHLSHLDDLPDDSPPELDPSLPRSRSLSDRSSTPDRATLPFHFANRASVSLRTPKHVFHSFGICTLATTRGAAVPAPARRTSTAQNHAPHHPDLDGFVSSDSWFVGAFGRWWRGGLVESWYYDAMIRSKDAQGWSSGILSFKALDKFHDYNALPLAKFAPYPRSLLRGSPPKLRNRERSAQRAGSIPHRNTSPPPLPKSVSLPLHTDHRLHDFAPVTSQLSSHLSVDQICVAAHAPPVAHTISRTSSTSGTSDHSPTIADVLRQIAAAQASVHDLQNQLQDAQNAANQSRDSLEAELTDLRLRRREDDQKRLDGRARTKSLEEARRLAETTRREAEKKMKIARDAKDSAMRKVEELELDIQALRQRVEHDHAALAEPSDAAMAEEEELICELERKKKQVRVAEELVVALNIRARDLEDRIDESKSLLRATRRHGIQLPKAYASATDLSHWDARVIDQYTYPETGNSLRSSSYNPFDVSVGDVLVSSTDSSYSPAFSSGASSFVTLDDGSDVFPALRSESYTASRDDISSVDSARLSPRSAHGHHGYFQPVQANYALSPLSDPPTPSAAFIPSSLISVLDSPSADWKGGFGVSNSSLTTSPVDYSGDSLKADSELDLADFYRMQEASGHDSSSMHQGTALYETDGSEGLQEIVRQSRETNSGWLSIPKNDKHRSGLNPDAKVFRLTRFSPDKAGSASMSPAPASSYDALNPTGLASNNTSSTPSSLLRAFAPSRAEREALQRALGGSTNVSLERLPSLSDVGSIPSSPAHARAEAQGRSIGEKDCALPVWLQSLPLIRKPNFSPWEDEDVVKSK